jgi:hypothetical protein
MYSLRSFVPVGLIALALSGVAGCKKDDPPKPDPAAKPTASARNKLNVRNPMGPVAKIDPQTMKDYRLDVCYYGTLSLRQARDSYLASLGKDEPSEKKIPNFGAPAAPGAGAAPSASGAASAAPKAPPPAKPAASGTAQASAASSGSAAPAAPPERKADFLMRAPHERNARACTAAVALKDPAMGEVDAAVAAFAPFAVELAKDITTTNQYYQREEHKKDGFAKGKELDKKLRDGFAKLDELHDKLGAALNGWRKEHPADASKREEGEKMARETVDGARDIFVMVAYRKVEPDAYKAALDKLEKSIENMKAYAAAHAADPWAKIMAAPFEAFLKTAKDSKVTADKTFEAEAYLTLVSNFTGLIEARQRAISRTLMAKPAAPAPAAPGAASAEPAPAPH